ncbi:MAG TPA: Mth938-like domain-containing protein [Steroidobacteraceae bacterium]|nr:Mth938-like domain-containing protein [Steroidobacteraceae bacterium]
MQLAPDTHGQANLIAGYAPGELRLRDRVLRASAIVTASEVLPWPVAGAESLTPELLAPVLALRVEVVLLATGARQVWPPPAVLAHLAARGVGLEVMDLGAACRTFNLLVGDRRQVALAAILRPP